MSISHCRNVWSHYSRVIAVNIQLVNWISHLSQFSEILPRGDFCIAVESFIMTKLVWTGTEIMTRSAYHPMASTTSGFSFIIHLDILLDSERMWLVTVPKTNCRARHPEQNYCLYTMAAQYRHIIIKSNCRTWTLNQWKWTHVWHENLESNKTARQKVSMVT